MKEIFVIEKCVNGKPIDTFQGTHEQVLAKYSQWENDDDYEVLNVFPKRVLN